jgi:hypothetical protein
MFQQQLSSEKTPTLCDAIPSFERLIKVWEDDQHQHPETSDIVQAGIDKLEGYSEQISDIPAYVLAMSSQFSLGFSVSLLTINSIVLNPSIKLGWLNKYMPEKVAWAKKLLLQEVSHVLFAYDSRYSMAESWVHITNLVQQLQKSPWEMHGVMIFLDLMISLCPLVYKHWKRRLILIFWTVNLLQAV